MDLGAAIEEGTATSARLNAEISALNQEVAKNQQSLDQATALRQRQLAEFNAEEKDMLQSISALKSAVVVLGKHHEAMLQANEKKAETAADTSELLSIAVMLKQELKKHKDLLGEVI